jgi:N-methylhydantoinase A/oxoprolinase/acetone carboxylase beta subunit
VFIGIDVGGTYTDAVLTDGKKIIGKKKFLTRHDDLLSSLLGALDAVLAGQDTARICRVVLSTTLVTNIIAEKKYPPVALILAPGPGLNPAEYRYDTLTKVVAGAVDYRGREIVPVNPAEIKGAGQEIKNQNYDRAAVVGKFSSRNNKQEIFIKDTLAQAFPDLQVEMGHQVAGQLNYPRRIATTMLNAATKDVFAGFVRSVQDSLQARNITAPVFILKADGGTIPLNSARQAPVETIFSGPAASTMGALCLSPRDQSSVVVDIGGTTTDLALILCGEPLLASKGARVQEYLTHVRSFAVKSVPLGGDSRVIVCEGKVEILPERSGRPYCWGGAGATPTDALRYLGQVDVGDQKRAAEIMAQVARETGMTPGEAAEMIVEKASLIIVRAIEDVFREWEEEPAYRVWQITRNVKFRPDNIVGVGGAANGLIPEVARLLGCRAIIPEHAEVANALGAAVARPTVTVNLRIDTEQGYYATAEDGSTGAVPTGGSFTEAQAVRLAEEKLYDLAEKMRVREFVERIEVVRSEVFNLVRGWTAAGKIFDINLQTPRDILCYLGKGESADEEK